MTLDSLPLVWPVGVIGMSEEWGYLMKDFSDDQGLRFFRIGRVCQESVRGQLLLLLRKGRERLIQLCYVSSPWQLTFPGL